MSLPDLTLSTCWYSVKSKFDEEIYRKWISNFICNVDSFYLIIYTNTESVEFIKSILVIDNKKVKIVIVEWNEFYCYQFDWQENHKNNNLLNDNSIHKIDWKLNMLWNEKINFVKRTIDKNFFNTKWFGWCDIGYFRGDRQLNVKTWPSTTKINSLKTEKLYYGFPGNRRDINEISKIILTKNEYDMPINPIPENQVTVAGGFFLCHITTLDWWWNTYYTRMGDYFRHKYLIKDDQILVIDCIINNLKYFEFIVEPSPYKDKWFVFQEFLK